MMARRTTATPTFRSDQLDPETHEQRSCLRKTRYATEPSDQLQGDHFYAYECIYCDGWHLATSKRFKNGDVRYTEDGCPIVPFCGRDR